MRATPVGLRAELLRTIEDLAAFGEKRVGTEGGERAAAYLAARLEALGLSDVHTEPFAFPRHQVTEASLRFDLDGGAHAPAFAVLEASAGGDIDAEVVHVEWATDEQLRDKDLRGRVALVDRNSIYHRSTQYDNVARAGAAAMILSSTAPANLPQVGSVRSGWEAMGPIPALTIGSNDGHAVRAALDAGRAVRAHLAVAAQVDRGVGRNVIGSVPGDSDDTIVIGAHFDTWFAGATDNGGGVAAILALAARRARRPSRYGLTFVGWDGEEIALYGGYHFLREHAPRALCVIDFETPSALGALAYGLARSNHQPLHDAIDGVGLNELFALNVPMDLVPELFGGVIPTDVQGLYRAGTAAIATAVDAPYYHTAADTPDKVDLARLEETVEAFDRALDRLLLAPADRFRVRDPALWRIDCDLRRDPPTIALDVRVLDGAGRPCDGAVVDATLFYDDFFERGQARAASDRQGRASLRLTEPERGGDGARRFVHITAGARFPLAERVLRI